MYRNLEVDIENANWIISLTDLERFGLPISSMILDRSTIE